MSDYCSLFSQTFYGWLFSYLTITDVTSYVHHKFPVSFLLYIATKKIFQINRIFLVNSSMNALSPRLHKKKNNSYSCTSCVPMFSKFWQCLYQTNMFEPKRLILIEIYVTRLVMDKTSIKNYSSILVAFSWKIFFFHRK